MAILCSHVVSFAVNTSTFDATFNCLQSLEQSSFCDFEPVSQGRTIDVIGIDHSIEVKYRSRNSTIYMNSSACTGMSKVDVLTYACSTPDVTPNRRVMYTEEQDSQQSHIHSAPAICACAGRGLWLVPAWPLPFLIWGVASRLSGLAPLTPLGILRFCCVGC